ncbi:hypothetical protein PFJ87_10g02050 [Encephalitozoon hellem]|uniref:Uncharacterized protein n=1 Tax=Encephalitozoon hellem TaxID=27973 RepID=A0ABY8CMU8_ENCHE|nr:hypothetical protein PFJ87_07g00160 [Encephalitozoon hellem]WEL39756.1 hypothetical protein PFJ87_10g02050 [Encephalitozoon hellem]
MQQSLVKACWMGKVSFLVGVNEDRRCNGMNRQIMLSMISTACCVSFLHCVGNGLCDYGSLYQYPKWDS